MRRTVESIEQGGSGRRARWRPARLLVLGLSGACLLLDVSGAIAQEIRRPADEAPEVPAPGAAREPQVERAPAPPLPPLPADVAPLAVHVRSIEVRGSTVLSRAEIVSVTRPFVDRLLSTPELLELTGALTRLYSERGYATSGALLPDQDLEQGRLVVQIVEGSVDEIRIEGNDHFAARYLRDRLRAAASTPLRLEAVTDRLALLQRNPRIERVDAVLEPTTRPGVSHLSVVVREADPWQLSFFAANDLAGSVGSENGGVIFGRANLIGIDDEVVVWTRFSEGVREVQVSGRLPVSTSDTELRASYQYTDSEIVTPSLDDLEIRSESHYVNLELSQPLYRSRTQELRAGVIGSWSRTGSSLLGQTYCFQQTIVDCTPIVSALRLRQEYALRTRATALSIRSTLSFGLDLLWATSDLDDDLPDGEFVSWLGQVRVLHRLPMERWGLGGLSGTLLALRGDIQLSDEPLLPSEQIALGGPNTVRGYRRNALVRDNAMIGSVELRVPVWKRAFAEPVVELAPFIDVGRATDVNVIAGGIGASHDREISSVGLAVRIWGPKGLELEGSWAHRLNGEVDRGEGLQSNGIYFRVTWNAF